MSDPYTAVALERGTIAPHVTPSDGASPLTPSKQPAQPPQRAFAHAHAVCRKWLGETYDLDAWDVSAAAAAAESLAGDPPWLMLISGSGNAKTETVQALTGAGALLASRIKGEASLLSATPRKERASDATGGLLRRIGNHGVLVIKDFTSILSMNRDARADVLSALREIHDGRWTRDVGAEGGRVLTWSGRIVVVAAVTTAWDRAHAVIAEMGDRFICLRMDSSSGRLEAGRQALDNVGRETQMREELAAAMATLLEQGDYESPHDLTEAEDQHLLAAADLVTFVRTAVDLDYAGNVIDAHAPEMPTRFAKQLAQIMRGSLALGMCRPCALRLAVRAARDSVPPLRLAAMEYLYRYPGANAADVRRRMSKPRTTIRRVLETLDMLEVCDSTERRSEGGKITSNYVLSGRVDISVLVCDQKCQNPSGRCSP